MAYSGNFDNEYKLGDEITVDLFADADFVDVIGTSKGKDFRVWLNAMALEGRPNYSRAEEPPSCARFGWCILIPFKGIQGNAYGWSDGNRQVTMENLLQVIKVMPEHNVLLVKGSVPGAKGAILLIVK